MTLKIKKLFVISLIVLLGKLFSIISLLRKLIGNLPVFTDLFVLGIYLMMMITALIAISNVYWRFGFAFIIAASIIEYFSRMISHTSNIGAILLSLFALLFLFPASFCFYKFTKISDVHIYGEHKNSSIIYPAIILIIVLILVVLTFIFWGF
ncbi:MAG: hypothetical protein HY026_07540 [Deltaproteobacteria bacterium]|nr:hypothetical protein [Deltaproteobacteria bacterium]